MLFRSLITLLLLIISNSAFAQSKWSLGLGYQHASVIGVQYGYFVGKNKFLVAASVAGAAVGYERVLDAKKKHALGFAIGAETFTAEDGFAVLTYDYHFNAQDKSGWQLGASAGWRREDDGSFFANLGESRTETALSIEVSYQF